MPRVIALGQRYGGDDGVGLAIAEVLRARGAEVVVRGDAAALVDDLLSDEPIVLVDAVVGVAAIGEVVVLDGYALAGAGASPVSSHGMSVRDAVALACALHGAACAPSLAIVGIGIAPPSGLAEGLSEPVAAAVDEAAVRVRSLLGDP